MVNAVILDWSGVVSDDWQVTFATTNDVLEEMGYKRLPEKRFKKLYELPWMRFYEKQGIEVDVEREYKQWERLFPKHYDKVGAFPFAKQTLQWLKENEKKVLVFSSHSQKLLEKEMKDYGFSGLIDFIDASNEDKREKIDALIERHLIERESTLFVGDMVHDIETAKQAGIKSVAVLSGYDGREKLEKAKPDFIIKDLGELPALIEKIEGEANG